MDPYFSNSKLQIKNQYQALMTRTKIIDDHLSNQLIPSPFSSRREGELGFPPSLRKRGDRG